MILDIIGKRNLWFLISGFLIALGIFAMGWNWTVHGKPLNFGIDFTGGTILNLRFEKNISIQDVRSVLAKYKLAESVIQKGGATDFYIRTEPLEAEVRSSIIAEMREKFGGVELLEADTIGPVIGKELQRQAFWALVVASLGMIIYITFRFEFKYAIAAIIALYHDAIITTGLIALLWVAVDTPFVAAILTIMGYSINDTIVIFDRIRENLGKVGKTKINFGELINESITQTLARSINTVFTTLIMAVMLLIFGGEPIRPFALTLFIGFTLGACSSIFVAPPILFLWEAWESRR